MAMRGWVKMILILFVLPILVGGVVLLVAGRPVAFEALQRRIARKFPEVEWIKTEDLARWRDDPGQPQAVVLDGRTEEEFRVSQLRGAVRIDPYRPSLQPLQGFAKDTQLVVYSSAGYRGARVASWLGRAGYTNVRNLSGGIFKWADEGRPIFRGETPAVLVHPYDRNWGLLVAGKYRADAPAVEKRSAGP
jgi:rhodanese-related sulfurtransferase